MADGVRADDREKEVTVLLAVLCRHQMTPRQDFLHPGVRQPIRRTVVRPPRPGHDRDREPPGSSHHSDSKPAERRTAFVPAMSSRPIPIGEGRLGVP